MWSRAQRHLLFALCFVYLRKVLDLKRIALVLLVAVATVGWVSTGVSAEASEKKVILVGCVADPQDLLDDLARVKELPFDGYLLHGYDDRNLPSGDLAISRSVFGPRALKFENYQRFIKVARQVQAAVPKLTENFLKVGSLPGTLEMRHNINENYPKPGKDKVQMWGKDFSVVVNNFRVAAEVAKAAGMRGIQLDLEMYGGYYFDPRVLVGDDVDGMTPEQLKMRVRECGREVMIAMQSAYPGLTVFLFYGYMLADDAHQPHYQLAQPFLDGLFEASDEQVRIVDGYEDYTLQSVDEFSHVYRRIREEFSARSATPELYAKRVSVAFPVWPAVRAHKAGATKPEAIKNLLYSPQEFSDVLSHAFARTDRYVWLYSHGSGPWAYPNWWTGSNVPRGYVESLRDARDNADRTP